MDNFQLLALVNEHEWCHVVEWQLPRQALTQIDFGLSQFSPTNSKMVGGGGIVGGGGLD
jgi:hypothetical protein